MKNLLEKITQPLKKEISITLDKRPVTFVLALAFLLTLTVEMAGRHSLLEGITFLFTHPIHFAANMALILVTLGISLFFRRRVFFLSLCSSFWLILGITNATLLLFRNTPLGAADVLLLPSVMTVIRAYMETWQILLLLVAITLIPVVLTYVFIKSPKHVPSHKTAALFVAFSIFAAAFFYGLTVVGHQEERSQTFANVSAAYDRYGFVYCFCTSTVEFGIDEPKAYSQAAVGRLVRNLKEGPEPDLLPNIIMVQLESFFDVSYLDDVTYEENPIPTFTYLKDNYSSGFLTVPSIGAGTANTEFEVLSEMSLDFFGMGEYPYNTILQETACETIATDLKALGYAANAIHNNTGAFYLRDKVFAQLGFDTFTSIEFMENIEYNPIGWAKDHVLTEEILKALDSNAEQNFVFAITVQGHGKYQKGIDSEDAENLGVTWHQDEEDGMAFAYYVSQLQETDAFIRELVTALSRRAEPTVLVLYGDHLPSFNIGTEELANGDVFETEYVIWDNIGLPAEDKDLSAYQLSAEVMGRLGISSGMLTKYHQQMADKEHYLDGLNVLEYDMLYGERYCYGGENPYVASPLRMGLEPITISGITIEDQVMTVRGDHFTSWSRVSIDEDLVDTTFVDRNTLEVQLREPPKDGAVIKVQQISALLTVLSESAGMTWTEDSGK